MRHITLCLIFSDFSQRPPPFAQAKHLRTIFDSPLTHTQIQPVMTSCCLYVRNRSRIPPLLARCPATIFSCEHGDRVLKKLPLPTSSRQSVIRGFLLKPIMNRLCSFSAQNASRISHLTRTKLKVFTRTYKALPDLAPRACLHLSHCSPAPTSLYCRQASGWGLHTMVSFAWNPLLSSLSSRITFSMRPH